MGGPTIAQAPTAPPSPPVWKAPWEFAVHALVGTLIFGIIAGVAVILDLAVKKLEGIASRPIIYGIKYGEFALLFVDLVMFTIFLIRAAIRMGKKL